MNKFDSVIVPTLMVERPSLTETDVKVFKRKWEVSCSSSAWS